MDDNRSWDGYFAKQYACSYSRGNLLRAKRFIHGQFEILNKIVPVTNSDVVLEIGCAFGAFVETLKERGVKFITATELDHQAAEYTRQTQDVAVLESSIEDIEPSTKYSKIYSFEVLEHLRNPLSDIAKIYSILVPGGVFIGSTPYPFKRSITSDASHMFVLHPLNWARLFKEVGFEVVMMRPASGLPLLYRLNKLFSLYFKFYIPFLPIVSTTLFVVRRPFSK